MALFHKRKLYHKSISGKHQMLSNENKTIVSVSLMIKAEGKFWIEKHDIEVMQDKKKCAEILSTQEMFNSVLTE